MHINNVIIILLQTETVPVTMTMCNENNIPDSQPKIPKDRLIALENEVPTRDYLPLDASLRRALP